MNKTFYTDVIEIGDLRFAKYIESRAIEEKVREIADSIREDYHDKNPLFLVVKEDELELHKQELLKYIDAYKNKNNLSLV